MEMNIDDFYSNNGATLFIDRMAAFLSIPTDKMRIVSIVAGSVEIDYEIAMDETTKSSSVVSQLVAPATTSTSSTSTSSTNSCGGVSTGIAAALSSGELNLGLGQVSDMSYTCSKVVEDDASFESTKKSEDEQAKNPSSGNKLISGGVASDSVTSY